MKDEDAARVEFGEWATRTDLAQLAVSRALATAEFQDVLDIGGGSGLLAARFAQLPQRPRVTVLDHSSSALERVPIGITRVVGDFEEAARLGRFDLVLLRQVLHYMQDVPSLVASYRQCISESGIVYVGQLVTPSRECADWLQSIAERLPGNRRLRHYDRSRMLDELSAAGLSLLDSEEVPYRGSVARWISSTLAGDQRADLLQNASETLDASVRSLLSVEGDDLAFTQKWFSGVFRFESGADPA